MKKLLALLLCISTNGFAQESLSIERIYASPALDGTAPDKLTISPDGKRVTFLQGKQDDFERLDLWEYHIDSGETRLLVNSDDLHQGEEALSDEERARRERMRLSGSGIVTYTWSTDGKAILFPLAGDAYYYRLAEGDKPAEIKRLLNTEAFETDVQLSPKGNFISYIREQNLYVKNIASGKETAITTQGGGDIKYGMAEFVAQEEMSRLTGYWWSPDEQHIAFTRVDESPVDVITRSEIYADSITMIEQKYPSAGTDNVDIQLAIQHIGSGERQQVDLGENKDIYLARGQWAKDNIHFTYQVQSRNQQTLWLKAYNLSNRQQKVLITESSNTWVNLHDALHFLKDKQHYLWASERDGFKHLYLYHINDGLVRQLTQGDWVVTSLDAVDEATETVYFSGRKDTPIENHLYRVNLAGDDVQRISQRDGFHNVSFGDSADIYVDKFSTVNTPPQVSLHRADGERIAWLEENQVDENHPLHAFQQQWVAPEFGTFSTADNETLHYRLYKPQNMSGKHPVIVYLYGGPGVQVVTNQWGGHRGLLMQHWVNKGYVVFSVDNRGSKYRGKKFEDPLYLKMGDIEVQDQIAGVKFLHTLPYVDKKRIGVYGHSYGGYMSIMAMFKGADYFAAGVAGAPVTDWRLYDTHYTERFMGDPREVDAAYTAASVFPHASNLKGPLLIYHGMADDNVLFTHATKLYKHLQDMALPFEVMDYPGKKHSIRGEKTRVHLGHTITNFFDRNLMPSKPSVER
ncbi:S9 family peptidase [Alteromonas oceanisediminis]|uniref:S9 family peptidase n=1 Tax=Alteromonas oceanisediminis TaxID=2836180 RepID=UPI001BDA99E0|nr:S9 family peptidase [Alteromonas oceanisediminis]MBT0585890.1 DPP IV N-terminal domain-containing protein [Alteromonas oceanisediminis]